MFERMLDKSRAPSPEEIEAYIGAESQARLEALEAMLESRYDLNRELRFPFGNNYGWGYKYSHKKKHMFYLFFEKGAVTLMMQIGDKAVPLLEKLLPELSAKARELWENRYPCGEQGGWIRYRITADGELDEVIRLVECREKPR